MFRIITLLIGFLFNQITYANGFFISGDIGVNATKSSPVGDLPLAREEFGISNFSNDNMPKYQKILSDIQSNGGTTQDAINAASDINDIQLNFKTGINFDIAGGYEINNVAAGIYWKYIDSNYKSINSVSDGKDSEHPSWDNLNGSGETLLNAVLGFANYTIAQLKIYNIMPTIGGGLGIAYARDTLKINDVAKTRNQIIFAYQINIGLTRPLSKNLHGNINSVFFGTSKIKAINTILKQWQFINIGLRYLFS